MGLFEKIKSWFSPVRVPAKEETFDTVQIPVFVSEPVVAPAPVEEKAPAKKALAKEPVAEKKVRKPRTPKSK